MQASVLVQQQASSIPDRLLDSLPGRPRAHRIACGLRASSTTTPPEDIVSQPPRSRIPPGTTARMDPTPDHVHVLLASDEGSCVCGARTAVTGGQPIL